MSEVALGSATEPERSIQAVRGEHRGLAPEQQALTAARAGTFDHRFDERAADPAPALAGAHRQEMQLCFAGLCEAAPRRPR